MLTDLPDLLARLEPALLPPTTGAAEYVSGGSFRSALPTSDVLDLLAVTPHAVKRVVLDPVPPEPATPPGLWVTAWAATWRRRFGHHSPMPVRGEGAVRGGGAGVARTVGFTPAAEVRAVVPGSRPTKDAPLGVAEVPGVWLGRPAVVDEDPFEREWSARFGLAAVSLRVRRDANYLSAWLTRAADEFDDVSVMVRGLCVQVAAVRRVLGEVVGRVYLGRCPEVVTDERGVDVVRMVGGEDGGVRAEFVRCGAPLYRSGDGVVPLAVECRSCGVVTAERGLMNLAMRMRHAWGSDELPGRGAWGA